MKPSVTVVLLNWRRQDNLQSVLDSIAQQSVRPEIFLWNNGAEFFDPRITWQVNSSTNKFCWPRWFMAAMARTEFVCSLDDDLAFGDRHVLADALECAAICARNCILGPFGVRLIARSSYLKSEHIAASPDRDMRVDIVKGRMMLFRREQLQRVGMLNGRADVNRNDDIALSGALSRGRAGVHRVPALFYNRFVELAERDCGLASQPEHFDSREKAKNEYFRGRARFWFRLGASELKNVCARARVKVHGILRILDC